MLVWFKGLLYGFLHVIRFLNNCGARFDYTYLHSRTVHADVCILKHFSG